MNSSQISAAATVSSRPETRWELTAITPFHPMAGLQDRVAAITARLDQGSTEKPQP
jgi:hypothetical protein